MLCVCFVCVCVLVLAVCVIVGNACFCVLPPLGSSAVSALSVISCLACCQVSQLCYFASFFFLKEKVSPRLLAWASLSGPDPLSNRRAEHFALYGTPHSRQRTADHGIGFRIGRACDIDCSLPCNLVAAGPFGAIDPKTGQAMYNVTTAPLPQSELDTLATALGVAYYVNQPIAIASGHDDTTTRNNGGTLVAVACSSVDSKLDVLWSAPLPASNDGGYALTFKKIILPSVRSGKLEQPSLVLVGGHEPGLCTQGHCRPGMSSIAAFRAPLGIAPLPL